jgi:uncharacterized UBP type Zn finger protein
VCDVTIYHLVFVPHNQPPLIHPFHLPACLQPPTPSIFTFGLEDRVQCATTGAVSYRPSSSTALSLHIPLEAAANAGEVAAYQERQAKRQKLEAEQVGG